MNFFAADSLASSELIMSDVEKFNLVWDMSAEKKIVIH